MNFKRFLKKYWFVILVFTIFTTLFLFLGHNNWERACILIFSLIIWFLFSIKFNNMFNASILYILITLPFNITYQLPNHVLFFNTDPYVSGIYTNYLVPTLSIVDIGLVLILISFVYTYGIKILYSILKTYIIPLVIFLSFILMQNILNLNFNSLVFDIRLILGLIDTLLVVYCIKIKEETNWYKYGIVIGITNVVIQGAMGLIQFMNGSSIGLGLLGESQVVNGMQGSSFITLNNEVFLRAYGTFPHPNLLAGYLVINMLLSAYLISKGKGSWKILNYVWFVLSGLFIWITFSRIGIVLSILCFIVTVASQLLPTRAYSFTPLLFLNRFMNLFVGGDTSWNDRVNLMKASFNTIKNNWLIGVGLGNFTKSLSGNIPLTSDNVMLVQPVHNVFLLMLSELGILGSLSYLYIVIMIWINNYTKMNMLKWLVIISLFIIGMFDHYLWSLPQGNVIAVVGFILLLI